MSTYCYRVLIDIEVYPSSGRVGTKTPALVMFSVTESSISLNIYQLTENLPSYQKSDITRYIPSNQESAIPPKIYIITKFLLYHQITTNKYLPCCQIFTILSEIHNSMENLPPHKLDSIPPNIYH